MKKKVVVALGHRALGTTLPEQKVAVKKTAVSIADLVEEGYQVVITHSNGPQVGMIHTAMNEFSTNHPDYTASPMSVCSAMSQGYIGYDLQNAIREELIGRGIYRSVWRITDTADLHCQYLYINCNTGCRTVYHIDVLEKRSTGWFKSPESSSGVYDDRLYFHTDHDSIGPCKLYPKADIIILIE